MVRELSRATRAAEWSRRTATDGGHMHAEAAKCARTLTQGKPVPVQILSNAQSSPTTGGVIELRVSPSPYPP